MRCIGKFSAGIRARRATGFLRPSSGIWGTDAAHRRLPAARRLQGSD